MTNFEGEVAGRDTQPASTLDDPPTERPRLSVAYVVSFNLALFGLAMTLMTPAIVTLALRVSEVDPENYIASYGFVAGIGALVAVISNPIFGKLSDNTKSRFGMRRPWIIAGSVGTVVGAVVVGFADSLTGVLIGWLLMQLFANAAIAPLVGTIADQAPPAQQGMLGAAVGTTLTAAVVVGTFFVQLVPTNPLLQMGVPGIAALVFVGIYCAVLRDRKLAADAPRDAGIRALLGTFKFSPGKSPAFSWVLISILIGGIGLAALSAYMVYLLQDFIKVPAESLTSTAFYAVLVLYGVSTIVSFLSGYLSDRVGQRRWFFAASVVILALASVVIAAGGTLSWFFVGVSLAGVGMGVFYGSYMGLAISTLNSPSTYARDLGLVNIVATLPSSLVPFVAPLLLGIGSGNNYPALLLVLAAASLIAIPLLARVKKAR